MNNKIIDIIVLILFAIIIIDGFAGEFSSPTIFDFIKWGCSIICAIAYLFYRKTESGKTR